MDRQDRKAIEDLFSKLAAVEKRTGPRDPEAEAFIREAISAQPGAPYYMAQTIIVQEQALEAARQRMEELEGGERREAGGFLSGLFGGRSDEQARATRARVPNAGRVEPWEQQNRGGGFLAGAAQTAMGVAGGLLLGNFIAGALFGGPDAQASEASDSTADQQTDADTADAEAADADYDAGGGDFGGDFGGFDA